MTTKKYFFLILMTICLSFFFLYSCVPAKKAQKPKKVVVQQCLDCHQEFKSKFTSGIVHAPVKDESCYSCHRPHGLYGKIVFRAQQPELCYECHESVKPSVSAVSIHEPLKTANCTECHNSHNSNYQGLLKAEGDASCFACHDQAPFQRKLVHQPLEQGCDTCHDPHYTENVALLKQKPDTVCKSCHDVAEEGFSKAHFTYPVTTGCVQCHTPHSAINKGLLKKNVHDPIRQGECDACHIVRNNKEIAIRDKADVLCLNCHEIHTAGESVHEPYTQGQCTACHGVHASEHSVLFAEAPEKVFLNCHETGQIVQMEPGPAEEKEKDEEKKTVHKVLSRHKPVVEGKCLECHKGHKSEQKNMLSQPLKTLCYKCHDQSGYAGSSGSHPPGNGLNCDTCHVPHDSQVQSLLKGDSQKDLCFDCHNKTSSERGRFSLHKPFSRGECGKCHQLHRPAIAGYLSKPYKTGELCLSCHDTIKKGGENYTVHAPVSQGQCSRCHAPHAADYEHVMLLPEGEQCYTCHRNVKSSLERKKVKHEPAESGMCTSCHSAHGSAHKGIMKKNQPALCLTCHIDVANDWLEGYPHKPAVKSCLECHGSHGTDQPAVLVKPSGSLCGECHDITTGDFITAHGRIKPKPDSCISCHNPHGSQVKSMLYPVVHGPFEDGTCAPCHPGGKE